MNIEKHAASPSYPPSTLDERRDNSKAGWSDAWLINALHREPPDDSALDILVVRYWKRLGARCRMLTLDRDAASDLAQESWLRVLQARGTLKAEGNFHAYLITIATNLWRDHHRNALRAGEMSDDRIESLDGTKMEDGHPLALMDLLTEPHTSLLDDKLLLRLDINNALERLSPHLRDALVSRFLIGESAAEIALRYQRTEQTISSWIREAAREIRVYLRFSSSIGAVLLLLIEPNALTCVLPQVV